jgi:nucleotide-binding universal stress UspA family protein
MKPQDLGSRAAPKKILLATDFSHASELSLPHALTIADHYGSTLYIAHVICPGFTGLFPPESTAATLQEARRFAQQNMERFLSAGRRRGVSCQPLIGEGAIWDVLLKRNTTPS